jgi:hypothetical protein
MYQDSGGNANYKNGEKAYIKYDGPIPDQLILFLNGIDFAFSVPNMFDQ